MKNTIFILAMMSLMAVISLTGCQTQTRRIEYALTNGLVAPQDQNLKAGMINASQDLKKAVTIQDWIIFKRASEFRISDNDIRIAELKVKMQRRGMQPDPIYKKKLNTLENVNLEMKKKIGIYFENQKEWISYKREFTHNLDKLEQTLTALTVKNEFSSKMPGDL